MKVWEAELTFHLTQLCHSWSFQNIAGINCQGSVEPGVQVLSASDSTGSFQLLLIDRDLLIYIFPCWNSYLCASGVSGEFACHKSYCEEHDFTYGVLSVGNSQYVWGPCVYFFILGFLGFFFFLYDPTQEFCVCCLKVVVYTWRKMQKSWPLHTAELSFFSFYRNCRSAVSWLWPTFGKDWGKAWRPKKFQGCWMLTV